MKTRRGSTFVLHAAITGLLLYTAAFDVAAQQSPVIEPGAQVRLSSSVYTGVATALNSQDDTLKIVVHGLQEPVTVPFAALESLERRRSATIFERALGGAKWGAIVGGGIGLMGALISDLDHPDDPPRALMPVVGAAYFAVPAALIGLAIPQQRWQRVRLPEGRELSWNASATQIAIQYRW